MILHIELEIISHNLVLVWPARESELGKGSLVPSVAISRRQLTIEQESCGLLVFLERKIGM